MLCHLVDSLFNSLNKATHFLYGCSVVSVFRKMNYLSTEESSYQRKINQAQQGIDGKEKKCFISNWKFTKDGKNVFLSQLKTHFPSLPHFQIWSLRLTLQAAWIRLFIARRSAVWRRSLRRSRKGCCDKNRYEDETPSSNMKCLQLYSMIRIKSSPHSGPGQSLPNTDCYKNYQQPAETGSPKPPGVHPITQPVPGEVRG